MTFDECEKFIGKFVSIEYELTTGNSTFSVYIHSIEHLRDKWVSLGKDIPDYVVFVTADYDSGYMRAILGLDSIKSIEQLSEIDEIILKLKFDL